MTGGLIPSLREWAVLKDHNRENCAVVCEEGGGIVVVRSTLDSLPRLALVDSILRLHSLTIDYWVKLKSIVIVSPPKNFVRE